MKLFIFCNSPSPRWCFHSTGVSMTAAMAAVVATVTLLSMSSIQRLAITSWNVSSTAAAATAHSKPASSTTSSQRWNNSPPSPPPPRRRRRFVWASFLSNNKKKENTITVASTVASKSQENFLDNNTMNHTTFCEACSHTNNKNPYFNKEHYDRKNNNRRYRNTSADVYFQTHGKLPKPQVMHAVLSPMMNTPPDDDDNHVKDSPPPRGILVMGDVHGCFEEMQLLYQKALQVHQHVPFKYVILVGDLVNKGPESAKVIRWVRLHNQRQQLGKEDMNSSDDGITQWCTVRGNHDDGALAAALGDEERRGKKKYQWVMEGEHSIRDDNDEHGATTNKDDAVCLSDDDVEWLAELPYTITIPGAALLGETFDTVVVHAGLIPNVELQEQTIETMITVREVKPVLLSDDEDSISDGHAILNYQYHAREAAVQDPKKKHTKKKKKHHHGKHNNDQVEEEDIHHQQPRPWAEVWQGPPRVIFGHDARRGLQQHDWAIGLDTGAVYGKQLTGIILPEQTLVSVDAVTTHNSPRDGEQQQ